MLFNSIEFALFLPIVFVLYWFVFNKKLKHQNIFLIIVSYFFYGYWDWRFLSLIIISSFVDYIIGKRLFISKTNKRRKILLGISILVNLGFLGFFKYFNFFIDSFIELFSRFNVHLNPTSLNIILPVGISFYTFQTLSYTIDIYRKKLEPIHDPFAFFAFVSFFPQLVAGPIERASNLLPQFTKQRTFNINDAKDGLKQIIWGLFKKIVIADQAAVIVDTVFDNYSQFDGSVLFFGAFFFAFQIYGDFSGYSDIAIGTAKLFGFNLMRNFAYPYFSRDIAEFWRRWHISLSTWFRDYVYIPLGGSRGSKYIHIRNLIITFTISGFWHGANWTFIFWGFLNGLYYIPLMLSKKQKMHNGDIEFLNISQTIKDFFKIIVTFLMTLIAWIFFRAADITSAFEYIYNMVTNNLISNPSVSLSGHNVKTPFIYGLFGILFMLIFEFIQRDKQHVLQLNIQNKYIRWSIYYLIVCLIVIFRKTGLNMDFIYFQF